MVSPMFNRILVDLKEEETVTSSGLIMSSSHSQHSCYYGVVASVGPGARMIDGSFESLLIAPGDRIAFDKRPDYQTVSDGSKKYVACRESDIIGIITA
jgi:co-chaperonin GroES (HSP10)